MLKRIVDFSLRYRLLALVGLAIIIVLGAHAWQTVPVDAFPDVTPVQVGVVTESPGLAPADVERLLTLPIESSLAGLPGVRAIRSISLFDVPHRTAYIAGPMSAIQQLIRKPYTLELRTPHNGQQIT